MTSYIISLLSKYHKCKLVAQVVITSGLKNNNNRSDPTLKKLWALLFSAQLLQ